MALQDDDFKADVLHRLKVIEERIGLDHRTQEAEAAEDVDDTGGRSPDSKAFGPLWGAVAVLQRSTPQTVPSIWRSDIVKELWLS